MYSTTCFIARTPGVSPPLETAQISGKMLCLLVPFERLERLFSWCEKDEMVAGWSTATCAKGSGT